MNTTSQQIAHEILNQLGGNKFIAMTGSKNFVSDTNSLRMSLTQNKARAKWLRITLNSMDTYKLEFITSKKTLNKEYAAIGVKIYDEQAITVKELDGVYCDQLQEIFTSVTGLYTHL